jgi:DNA-binding PadR family transcriptional regulator
MADLLIGTFQEEVLNVVKELGVEAYGMRIRNRLAEIHERDIHMPQVYAALSRLVKLGLLTSNLDNEQSVGRRGRTRRVYEINAHGLQKLSDVVRTSRGAGLRSPNYYAGEEAVSTA